MKHLLKPYSIAALLFSSQAIALSPDPLLAHTRKPAQSTRAVSLSGVEAKKFIEDMKKIGAIAKNERKGARIHSLLLVEKLFFGTFITEKGGEKEASGLCRMENPTRTDETFVMYVGMACSALSTRLKNYANDLGVKDFVGLKSASCSQEISTKNNDSFDEKCDLEF